jgi:hypothetical protein
MLPVIRCCRGTSVWHPNAVHQRVEHHRHRLRRRTRNRTTAGELDVRSTLTVDAGHTAVSVLLTPRPRIRFSLSNVTMALAKRTCISVCTAASETFWYHCTGF